MRDPIVDYLVNLLDVDDGEHAPDGAPFSRIREAVVNRMVPEPWHVFVATCDNGHNVNVSHSDSHRADFAVCLVCDARIDLAHGRRHVDCPKCAEYL